MSGEAKESKECQICWNSFNKSTRSKTSCPSCSLDVCRACVKIYLLSSSELAHCMNPDCKSAWDRVFIIEACSYSFINKKYKEHRTKLLLEQEKARFPETMPAVENYLKSKGLRDKIRQEEIELLALRDKWRNLKNKIGNDKHRLNAFQNGENISEEKKKEFKQKCGVDGCNGFLSSQWKCGICKNWTCPKCFEVLGEEKACGHECDPNSVASATLIKKETRNCPSCATPIYKVMGCDQMWCTQCHVAFSWKTGMRVNGVIHNPHFYQWQNNGGGAAPVQTPGAEMCGGLPQGTWQFRRRLNRILNGNTYTSCEYSKKVIELLQNAIHFQHYELDRLRRDCQGARDNIKLRIQFLCKELTEHEMKSKISSKDKMYEKKQALLQIYELSVHIFTENINDILQLAIDLDNKLSADECTKVNAKNQMKKTIVKNINTCHKLRIYANNEMIKISRTYKQVVGFINPHFRIVKLKIGNKEILPEDYLTTPTIMV